VIGENVIEGFAKSRNCKLTFVLEIVVGLITKIVGRLLVD